MVSLLGVSPFLSRTDGSSLPLKNPLPLREKEEGTEKHKDQIVTDNESRWRSTASDGKLEGTQKLYNEQTKNLKERWKRQQEEDQWNPKAEMGNTIGRRSMEST